MKLANRGTIALALSVLGLTAVAVGQTLPPPEPPSDAKSLKSVPVPEPANLHKFVADKKVAIQLGKALFWDMQVGSDGVTACATCHFQAGADSRSVNQTNPGLDGHLVLRANARLTEALFPIRQLLDPTDRGSVHTQDADDVVSSQGVFNTELVRIVPGLGEELVTRPPDPLFNVNGVNVRRVEPRNTPTVINAVFNHRNFWDGRAQNEFNGVNNWGDRDPDAYLYRSPDNNKAPLQRVKLSDPQFAEFRLTHASLASQAVAPILSTTEMSAGGRTSSGIGSKFSKERGKKVARARPLGMQLVHPQDSVLGELSRSPEPGLDVNTYEQLIRKAFRKEWWDSKHALKVDATGNVTVLLDPKKDLAENEYTLMEYNFALFFGLALQLYQATLVSDDTPYDRWVERRGTVSHQAAFGLQVFTSQNKVLPGGGIIARQGARCSNCHSGPEFTDASVSAVAAGTLRRDRDGQEIDRGFNNIGVRPAFEDLGVGGTDNFDNPLSATALCRKDPTKQRLCPTMPALPPAPPPGPPFGLDPVGLDGAFKAPGLRNVELTAPYFHNGGYLTLESVMAFYSRGGDFGCSKVFPPPLCGAVPGAAPLFNANRTAEMAPLGIPGHTAPEPGLSAEEQAALVAFMRTLTDERVRLRKAPFDHPQLFIPNGQLGNNISVEPDPARPGQALDRVLMIPAVGRNGGDPLPRFLQY